jgi:hypothetical protein
MALFLSFNKGQAPKGGREPVPTVMKERAKLHYLFNVSDGTPKQKYLFILNNLIRHKR